MSPAEWKDFLTNVTVPVAIIIAAYIFLIRFLWPWFTKQHERGQDDQNKRHADYLAEVKRGNDIAEQVTRLFSAFIGESEKNHVDLTSKIEHGSNIMIEKMTSHHVETIDYLKAITQQLMQIDALIRSGRS